MKEAFRTIAAAVGLAVLYALLTTCEAIYALGDEQ